MQFSSNICGNSTARVKFIGTMSLLLKGLSTMFQFYREIENLLFDLT